MGTLSKVPLLLKSFGRSPVDVGSDRHRMGGAPGSCPALYAHSRTDQLAERCSHDRSGLGACDHPLSDGAALVGYRE